MDIISFLLFSLLLSLCLHFFISKKKLPPGPTGLPILGSLLTIGDRPHESLTKLSKTYGPLMTVKFGLVNVVVASSSQMAKEILQNNDQAFLGRPTPDAVAAEKDYDMSMVWSSGQGPHWKKLRKICNTQIFTAQRLDKLQDLRHEMMRKMIERVEELRGEGERVHFGKLVFGTTLNLLSNTIFSGDMFDDDELMKELRELIGNMMELAGRPNFADYLPFLKVFDPQGIRRGMMVCYDGLHKLVDGVIGRRVERRARGTARFGDFLDVLLDCTTEELSPERLNCQNVKILLMDLFIGGTHSTTTTLEWAMAELLHNPPILAKAKQQLSKKFTGPTIIQEQHISHLPYLEAVLKESMRLHPTAPLLLPHRAEQQVQISGYTIPKHTQVFVNAWSILRDPAYWDDPTSFKPERFLDSESTDFRGGGRDFSYIPFGAGRRICPGLNLGVRMVSVILANLVHNFDWELPDGLKPEDMSMEDRFGLTLQKDEPLVAIPLRAINM